MTIEKFNKIFIGVILVAVFAYVLNILNIAFFANDFSQITSQLQTLAGAIPNRDAQQINSILEFLNNSANVVRMLLVTLTVAAGIASVIGLFLIKLFADRVPKYNSIFSNSGLIITALATIYMQFKLMPTFTGLISLILILATISMIAAAAFYLVRGTIGIYKIITSDEFKATDIAMEFGKVLSFIFIFFTGATIAIKISAYVAVSVVVQEIDLASVIDVMNYVDVDWNTIIPPVILSSGIITADKINLFINNLVDQYVLGYTSTVIQNIILSLSRSIIFNNIVAYISALVSAGAILYSAKNKFEYRNYVAIALMTTLAVIGFVYIGGLIINILSIGLVICIALIVLDIVKQAK